MFNLAEQELAAALAAVRAGHPLTFAQLRAQIRQFIAQHHPEQDGDNVAEFGVVAIDGQGIVGGGHGQGGPITVTLPGGTTITIAPGPGGTTTGTTHPPH